ncbi:MAG: DUF2341 domain-containing protein, partial [Leptospirales bacterium]
EGFAAVLWQTGADRNGPHRVQAVLLDESAQPLPAAAIEFQAHKGDARAVDYAPRAVPDPQGADLMEGVETARQGLDRLGEIKVNRAGDTINGSLTVDEDLEIKGTLTVRGDVIARDTDHMPGDVLLGDQDEDTITVHGEIKSQHSSGALRIADALQIRSPDVADDPLRVFAQIQGVAGRAFRKAVALDYSGGAQDLTDYQIALTIDTASLIAADHLRPDAGDLLFLDADETTALPYWLESGLNTNATKVWVRVPAIAVGRRIRSICTTATRTPFRSLPPHRRLYASSITSRPPTRWTPARAQASLTLPATVFPARSTARSGRPVDLTAPYYSTARTTS